MPRVVGRVFYYDLYSPYAYLSASRVERVLGEVEWRPVWLYPIIAASGREWRRPAAERQERMRGIDERARRYGLPPVVWPPSFEIDLDDPLSERWGPPSTLALARIARWSAGEGAAREYALAAFHAIFAEGMELAVDFEGASQIAGDVGLEADAALAALADQEVKNALRADTDAAIASGVQGLPTFDIGGTLVWGDDRLDEAAAPASR
jgi:2-hydroxychromene-2-carboxylate isomerase